MYPKSSSAYFVENMQTLMVTAEKLIDKKILNLTKTPFLLINFSDNKIYTKIGEIAVIMLSKRII